MLYGNDNCILSFRVVCCLDILKFCEVVVKIVLFEELKEVLDGLEKVIVLYEELGEVVDGLEKVIVLFEELEEEVDGLEKVIILFDELEEIVEDWRKWLFY